MKYITNSELEFAFVTMMNKLIFGHQIVLRPLLMSLRGIDSNNSMETLQEIDKKLADIEEQRKVLMACKLEAILNLLSSLEETTSSYRKLDNCSAEKNL
jgi:uncharacterized protein YaaW (UPF0174 family)